MTRREFLGALAILGPVTDMPIHESLHRRAKAACATPDWKLDVALLSDLRLFRKTVASHADEFGASETSCAGWWGIDFTADIPDGEIDNLRPRSGRLRSPSFTLGDVSLHAPGFWLSDWTLESSKRPLHIRLRCNGWLKPTADCPTGVLLLTA